MLKSNLLGKLLIVSTLALLSLLILVVSQEPTRPTDLRSAAKAYMERSARVYLAAGGSTEMRVRNATRLLGRDQLTLTKTLETFHEIESEWINGTHEQRLALLDAHAAAFEVFYRMEDGFGARELQTLKEYCAREKKNERNSPELREHVKQLHALIVQTENMFAEVDRVGWKLVQQPIRQQT